MNAALPSGAVADLPGDAPDLASDGVDTSQLFAQVPFNHLLGLQREYAQDGVARLVLQPRGQFSHTNWTGKGGTTASSTYTV